VQEIYKDPDKSILKVKGSSQQGLAGSSSASLDWQPHQVHTCYRRRFSIETSFRTMRDVHATTASRNAAVRFFLIALGFVLVNVWITLRWRLCQIPCQGGRLIDHKRLELQRLAHFLVRAIEQVYGTISVIYATAQPIDP